MPPNVRNGSGLPIGRSAGPRHTEYRAGSVVKGQIEVLLGQYLYYVQYLKSTENFYCQKIPYIANLDRKNDLDFENMFRPQGGNTQVKQPWK